MHNTAGIGSKPLSYVSKFVRIKFGIRLVPWKILRTEHKMLLEEIKKFEDFNSLIMRILHRQT